MRGAEKSKVKREAKKQKEFSIIYTKNLEIQIFERERREYICVKVKR